MGKRDNYFQRVAEFRDRFRVLSTDTLRGRLNFGSLEKEAAVAVQQVLDERTPTPDARIVPHRFSVDQYKQMIREGIISEDDRVELLHGEIVEKIGIGDPHAACVSLLDDLFHDRLGKKAMVRVQNPIELPTSMPEPDVFLLKRRTDYYRTQTPRPADVLLVVEVSESSLVADRTAKATLYAKAGIVEYWIANLIDKTVEVYRQPTPSGDWQSTEVFRAGQSVEMLAFPGITFSVDEIF